MSCAVGVLLASVFLLDLVTWNEDKRGFHGMLPVGVARAVEVLVVGDHAQSYAQRCEL